MAASTAAASGQGGGVGNVKKKQGDKMWGGIGDNAGPMVGNAPAAEEAMAAEAAGGATPAEAAGAVAPHGDEAHTGGDEAMKKPQKGFKGLGQRARGFLKKGMFGGLFYKMPAAGKYNNSPIEKNYGSPAQRGFHAPNKMQTFGVGDSNKEKMGGVGSNLLDK